MLLEGLFELPSEKIGKTATIRNKGIAELYLAFVQYLIQFQDSGTSLLRKFCELTSNSYWNYYTLSMTLHRIVKIVSKIASGSIFNQLIGLCLAISNVNITSCGLKEFISLLKTSNAEQSVAILDAVQQMLKSVSPQEVFAFGGGRDSGISLAPKLFPKEGYCFLAFLRSESSSRNVCIYKLVSSAGSQMSLFLRDSTLYYKVYNEKSSQLANTAFDNGRVSKGGEWSFIELYHTNSQRRNLVLG